VDSPTTRFSIIFVPGLKPKPRPDVYAAVLLRCLMAGLERVAPQAAALLESGQAQFELYPWTFAVYGEHRDFELDRAGVERLLAQTEPSQAQMAEIDALPRRAIRTWHRLADAVPVIGRLLISDRMHDALEDARRYLHDRDGIGTRTRNGLSDLLERESAAGRRLIVIGHSLGSVIAYDTLWELSRHSGVRVEMFFTLGSPLGTRFVREHLRGADRPRDERYPTNIRRWANFSARGELTSLYPRLSRHFADMVTLGLIEHLEDHIDLYNYFVGANGLNVHQAYGYVANHQFAKCLAEALLAPQN
jgi:hypothetical protein